MNPAHPTTPEPPVTVCRCCGLPLDAQWQPGLLPERPGYFLLTCWNKGCGMHAYTLSDLNYQLLDLTPYLIKETR